MGVAAMECRKPVLELLADATSGDPTAVDKLLPLVYDELRVLAKSYLARERVGHTLPPTALVHEAYLRLVGEPKIAWQDRAHFMALAARAMRRILSNHARAHRAQKRGGGAPTVSLEESHGQQEEFTCGLLALDDAMTSLAGLDPQLSRVVELRFFGGLTINETAEVMKVSVSTVERDWSVARAWLYRALE